MEEVNSRRQEEAELSFLRPITFHSALTTRTHLQYLCIALNVSLSNLVTLLALSLTRCYSLQIKPINLINLFCTRLESL